MVRLGLAPVCISCHPRAQVDLLNAFNVSLSDYPVASDLEACTPWQNPWGYSERPMSPRALQIM